MSNTPNESPGGEPVTSSGPKRLVPLVLASAIGLSAGGAAGALVAGPVMAERAVARAEVVAAEVVAKVASGELDGGRRGRRGGGDAAGPVYRVENLVLNPAQSGGTRFLLAALALELSDDPSVEAMEARDAEVRDAVLRVLGGKTVVQLADIAARPALKEELQAAVDSIMGRRTVSAVYLPQFVIQ